MRELLRTGAGALLVISMMLIGSLGLWIGTPLLWLWIGSQIEGATESIGLAMLAMLVGVVLTVIAMARLLARLSAVHRANRIASGELDPGHSTLEAVLVISAGVAIAAFAVWFFLFAGASPVPIGIGL